MQFAINFADIIVHRNRKILPSVSQRVFPIGNPEQLTGHSKSAEQLPGSCQIHAKLRDKISYRYYLMSGGIT